MSGDDSGLAATTTPRDREGRIDPPSLVELGASSIRRMILLGTLRPGQRLIEDRLCEQLGISRPPLREALRLLEHEGLVIGEPRRGRRVTPLTAHDAYEIITLRSVLERAAIELGMPVRDPARLDRCRKAFSGMAGAAREGDRPGLIEAAFEFHLAIVATAGHHRIESTYRSLYLQMRLLMAMNLQVRERRYENLAQHIERHRKLLDLLESGDKATVLRELDTHIDNAYVREMRDMLEREESTSPSQAEREAEQ